MEHLLRANRATATTAGNEGVSHVGADRTYPHRGPAQFSRALRKLDADAPKGLRLAFNEAAEVVVARVRPKIPKRTGRAARSLKAKSTRTQARVARWRPERALLPVA